MSSRTLISTLVVISLNLLAATAYAATITANDCQQISVQNAIDSASDGDTVVVRNGSCTWTSGVSIRGKGIHLRGESIGGVTLIHSAGGDALVRISPDSSHSVEVSALRFLPGSVDNGTFYMTVGGIGRPVLIHDIYMRIENFGVSCIRWAARGGVIWNNEFESLDSDGAGSGCIPIKAETDEFDTSWTTPSTFGMDDVNGDQNVYIEDNIFRKIINQSLDPDGNARIVVRNNIFDNSAMASHGADTGPDGMRHAEVYDNTFVFTTSGSGYNFPLPINYWMYIRGGSWLITDNTIPDITSQAWGDKREIVVTIQNLHRNAGPYPCWSTYPVPRQFGQGYDSGPTLEPSYLWNNSGSGSMSPGLSNYRPDQCGNNVSVSQFVNEGRDYFLGVRKPGYEKYAYPHPLRTSSTVEAQNIPEPPTDVVVE